MFRGKGVRPLVVLLAALLWILSCGPGLKTISEPPSSEESCLIIGSVILQNNHYLGEETEVIKKGLRVAVIGEVERNGKKKIEGYWTTTDENGYFYLADMPKGRYALKGIRGIVSRGALVTIMNPLRFSGSVYQIQPEEIVIFEGRVFPFEPQNRIVDLQNNIFVIDRTSEQTGSVFHVAQMRFADLKLITGERINRIPAAQYFSKKYPDSPWTPHLRRYLEEVKGLLE